MRKLDFGGKSHKYLDLLVFLLPTMRMTLAHYDKKIGLLFDEFKIWLLDKLVVISICASSLAIDYIYLSFMLSLATKVNIKHASLAVSPYRKLVKSCAAIATT